MIEKHCKTCENCISKGMPCFLQKDCIVSEEVSKDGLVICRRIIDYLQWVPKKEANMKKEFTKDMLENRMVVEYRNSYRRIVVDNVLMGEDGHANLTEYNDDLTNYWDSSLDIIRVFDKVNNFSMLSVNHLIGKRPLWERKEIMEVTLKEIAERFGVDEVKVIDG